MVPVDHLMSPPPLGAEGQGPYGLLAVDGAQVGLPLSVLREVVPRPRTLLPVPTTAPGLLGAVDLRGLVIPVLDLGRAMGLEPGPERGSIIAVARYQGAVVGLTADVVLGVTLPDPGSMQELVTDHGSLPVRTAFERSEDGSVVLVLDVPALAALPGVPWVREPAPTTGSGGAPGDGSQAEGVSGRTAQTMMWIRCGDFHLSVRAVDTHSVLPGLAPRATPMQGPVCVGVTTANGVEVGVVDLLKLLDLGSMSAQEPHQGILMQLDGGQVVLMVSEVLDIAPAPADALLELPPQVVRRPDYYRGVLAHPTLGQVLVLDAAALRADADVTAVSNLNQGDGPAREVAGLVGATATGAHSHLTYRIGDGERAVDIASPFEQVDEIVAFPAGEALIGTGSADTLGLMLHRGRAIPLLCLSGLLGRPPVGDLDRAHVLLVDGGDRQVGFVVGELRAIETELWREAADEPEPAGDGGPDRGDDPASLLRRSPLVQMAAAGSPARMLRVVALTELARHCSGTAPTTPRPPGPRNAVEPAQV